MTRPQQGAQRPGWRGACTEEAATAAAVAAQGERRQLIDPAGPSLCGVPLPSDRPAEGRQAVAELAQMQRGLEALEQQLLQLQLGGRRKGLQTR
jgi:hypothetical protein